jgi:hypothetical protein
MVQNLTNFSLADLYSYLANVELSNEAFMMSVMFSVAGAVILAKFTGNIGSLTVPLNFSALFVGAFVANWILSGVDIPTIINQQEVLLYTVAGMISGSFTMLWFTGPGGSW